MKRNIVLSLFLLYVIFGHSQTEITVVDPNTSSQFSIPFDPEYNYTYSQFIYYSSDIGSSGDISTVSFKWEGGNMTVNDITIYMTDVTYNGFDNNTDWEVIGNLTQVYNGSFTLGTTDTWYEITLDVSFTHDNTKNLLIAFDKNSTEDCWPCSDVFNAKETAPDIFTYPYMEYHSDATNPNPSSPPTASSIGYYVPGLKIDMAITLPIKLLSFETELLVNDVVEIRWVTGSEINNEYFHIEKLIGDEWVVIDKIMGAGNSSKTIEYKTYDNDLNDDIQYYRMKQVDFDGKFTYSNISYVNRKDLEQPNMEYLYIRDILGRDINNDYKIIKKL